MRHKFICNAAKNYVSAAGEKRDVEADGVCAVSTQ